MKDKTIDDCINESGSMAVFSIEGYYCPLDETICPYQSETTLVTAENHEYHVCKFKESEVDL